MNEKVWIMKWGLLGLKVKDFDFKEYEKRNFEPPFKIDDIINAFNESEYVYDIKSVKQQKIARLRFDGIYDLDEPLSISIKIPKRKMKVLPFLFSMVSKEFVDVGTEFNILYNGYFYLIYWEIDPKKYFFEGAPDVREILKKAIDESENFESALIPPTPFREKNLISCTFDEEKKDIALEKIEGEKVKFILPIKYQIENLFLNLYVNMRADFFRYFKLLERVNNLKGIERDMNERFLELANDCFSLQDLKFYHFIEKYRFRKEINRNITQQFIDISKYLNMYKYYESDKEYGLEGIIQNPIFKNHIQSFQRQIQHKICDIPVFSNLLDYSREVLKSHEMNIIYIFGVILAGLLTLFGIIIGKAL